MEPLETKQEQPSKVIFSKVAIRFILKMQKGKRKSSQLKANQPGPDNAMMLVFQEEGQIARLEKATQNGPNTS